MEQPAADVDEAHALDNLACGVAGREFTLAQIGPLTDEVSEDRLLEILEEALAARVVEEMP